MRYAELNTGCGGYIYIYCDSGLERTHQSVMMIQKVFNSLLPDLGAWPPSTKRSRSREEMTPGRRKDPSRLHDRTRHEDAKQNQDDTIRRHAA